MQLPRYNALARLLHWLIAGLIISQYVLAKLAERAHDNDHVIAQLAILANHKSIGITVLALAFLRLLWRAIHTPPALPRTMPSWQQRVSGLTHWLLYFLVIALPVSGWLMSSAKSYSVSWFNLMPLPDLVPVDSSLAERLVSVHELLAEVLFVLAVLHMLAAFKHFIIDKDGVMQRMAGWGGALIMLLSVAVVISQFGVFKPKSSAARALAVSTNQPSGATNIETHAEIESALEPWQIDYSQSFIKFSGDQAGAPFTGEWQQWQANIKFDVNDLAASVFDVRIDIASVASGDKDRDEHIVSPDFFDQQQFAHAQFQARSFRTTASGFIADGQLTMKGITKPIAFKFTVEDTDSGRVLMGTADVDRLAWNIGVGDWEDTTWVGQQVTVDVKVVSNQ